jgi:hypothetical protein
VRPVLTHASETWALSKADEKLLIIFARRIFRCIFGAGQVCGGKDTTVNYVSCLMSLTLPNTLK